MTLALLAPLAFAGPPVWVEELVKSKTGDTLAEPDSDGDGTPNSLDVCPTEDDGVDLDANHTPDCDETLIANHAFTSNLVHWSGDNEPTYQVDWSSDDLAGWSGSGALWAEVLSTAISAQARSRCTAVDAGQTYLLRGSLELDSSGTPNATLAIQQFASYNDCLNTAVLTSGTVAGTTQLGTTVNAGAEFSTNSATEYVRVVLAANNNTLDPAYTQAWFDHILLRAVTDLSDPGDDPN